MSFSANAISPKWFFFFSKCDFTQKYAFLQIRQARLCAVTRKLRFFLQMRFWQMRFSANAYNFNFRAKYRYKSCCNGRNDPCSVEILGTLCYCDTFCNRTHNSDCCPDYFTHCEGLAELDFSNQQPPETLARPDYSKIIFDTYFHFPFTKSWTFYYADFP